MFYIRGSPRFLCRLTAFTDLLHGRGISDYIRGCCNRKIIILIVQFQYVLLTWLLFTCTGGTSVVVYLISMLTTIRTLSDLTWRWCWKKNVLWVIYFGISTFILHKYQKLLAYTTDEMNALIVCRWTCSLIGIFRKTNDAIQSCEDKRTLLSYTDDRNYYCMKTDGRYYHI